MKKVYFLLLSIFALLFVYLTNPIDPFNPEKLKEKLRLKEPVKLDEETMIKIGIGQITQGFGKSFKYLKELESGKYNAKKFDDFVRIRILDITNSNEIIDEFRLNYKNNESGFSSLLLDEKDFNRLINFKNETLGAKNVLPPTFPEIYNNILWDQEILRYNEEYTLGKIFNRVIALDKTVNQYGVGSVVFYDIDDAILIPYAQGQGSKLLVSDGGWSSIIQFDSKNTKKIESFGSFGTGDENFIFNNGITFGRSYTQSNNVIYPVYIADIGNNRIVSVNYVINSQTGAGYFDKTTIAVFLGGLRSPYDISYFTSPEPSGADDKIWISEASAAHPALTCISVTNKEIVQRFKGYKYGDYGDSLLKDFSTPKLCTYDLSVGNFCALLFLDEKRNVVVPSTLDVNGIATTYINQNGDTIIQPFRDLIRFPEDYPITSVNIQRTSYGTVWYPYLWVTTKNYGNNIAMIHDFAINSNANTAYLGSTNIPRNTSYYFHDLTNTFSTNTYYDIFTSEIWNDSYGLRRYLPFIELKSDNVGPYCIDSTDKLLWKAVFLNECWIKLFVLDQSSGERLEIKQIEGTPKPPGTTEAVIWRLKGATAITGEDPIDIKLELPLKYYVFGGNIELNAKIYPECYNPINLEQYSEYISRSYGVGISQNCLPRPGGCPYLYVKNENQDYVADNNMLNRSEFSEGDITDKYKLRIKPFTLDDEIELGLLENENDNSYINMVKLYAVDYPSNRKMAITEDNQIVLYDSVTVLASDNVTLNERNITSRVNFHDPDPVSVIGHNDDQLDAHFTNPDIKKKQRDINNNSIVSQDFSYLEKRNEGKRKDKQSAKFSEETEPVAFITDLSNLQYPNPSAKYYAGELTATSILSNQIQKQFARREQSSVIVLPLFDDANKVDHVNILWSNDFLMKYLGVTNDLQYNGFTVTETSTSEAKYITSNSETDIINNLLYVDDSYGEVSSLGFIKMKFDLRNLPSVPDGHVRDYVIEVNGRYYRGNDSRLTDVKPNEVPLTYKLSQNYPNPFNPVTKIKFEIPKTMKVNLVIYDILGREVKELVNEVKEAGRYTVDFDGTNLASGVYFYRIEARQVGSSTGDFVQSKKMVLIK